jgi:tripartite-type tricarboxylate transporter receptor subunit TctC
MAFNDTLYSKLPYDSIKDFSPVSLLAISANVLTVGPSSSAKTVQDLVQLAKSRPGKLNYGSGGIGGSDHVCSEYFQSVTGTKLVNVSYRGSAPALADLAAGMIEMAFAPIASGMPLITSGKLRALGVSTTKRAPLLPTVPTLIEAGVPKFDYSTWYGIWATGGVPQPVVAKLNSEIGKALQAVDVRERMAALGAEASWSNAQQFSTFYQSEIKRWEPLLRTFAQ